MSAVGSGAVSDADLGVGVIGPAILSLTDARAMRAELTGSKAAALATAAVAGIDILPGVVLTTGFTAAVDAAQGGAEHPALRVAFARANGHHASLVARSSSVLEDTAGSSMAGQFDSVIGITLTREVMRAV